MNFSLHHQISLVRFFGRVKPRFAYALAVDHYLHTPFSLVGANTQKTYLVSFRSLPHILQIFSARHLAKIAKSVVQSVAVNMIYVLRRPFTGYVKPRQSMRQLFAVVDSNSPIAGDLLRPRHAPYKVRTPRMGFPNKNACCSVVTKRRAQMFDGAWWVRFHDCAFSIKGAT